MKRIEELEKMTIQELDAEALRTVSEVPEGLEKELEAAIASDSAARAARRRKPFTTTAACLAVAASLTAVGIFIFRDTPLQDTYDDPMEAYAEVERTFAYISEKMSPGIGLAMEGKKKFDNTTEILKQKK
ncbi:MAG: hypothetical protein ACI399_05280 [Candidatus Cryptobacteroides sp.]